MSVEERLARLERENRWMRRIGGLTLAAAAVVVLVGQGKEKDLPDLAVRSLTVKDAEGNKRITLGAGDRATLRFKDPGGQMRILLDSAADDGSVFALRDTKGRTRVTLGAPRSGTRPGNYPGKNSGRKPVS